MCDCLDSDQLNTWQAIRGPLPYPGLPLPLPLPLLTGTD